MLTDRQSYAFNLLKVAAAVADATAEHIKRKGFGSVTSRGMPIFTEQSSIAGLTDEDWLTVKCLAEGLLPQPQIRALLRDALA